MVMVKIALCSLMLVASCTVYDLESEDLILRPRVLAVRVDPPEARIGDTVRLIPLVATPGDFAGVIDTVWIDCDEAQGGGDGDSRDWCKDRTQERVLSTADDLVYRVPDNLPRQQVETLSFTGGYWKRLSVEVRDRLSGAQDRAFKRLVVQPAPVDPQDPVEQARFDFLRNRNPKLPIVTPVRLDEEGVEHAVVEGAPLQANTDYLFRFDLGPEQRQDYKSVVIDLTGFDPQAGVEPTEEELAERVRVEDRREVLALRYYRTDGVWGRDQRPARTVDSTTEEPAYYPAEITWALNSKDRSSELPARIKLWFVLRDGRGGMDWQVVDLPFERGVAPERPAEGRPQEPPGLRSLDGSGGERP